MKFLISKGKNVEEAINLGLKLMDGSKNNVTIEVITQGKESFFKILSKEAVVKLTMKENQKEKSTITDLFDEFLIDNVNGGLTSNELGNSQEIIKEELTGKVWIKDGEIFYEISEDSYPTLTIPVELTVQINGKAFKGKSLILSEKESYKLKSEVVEKEMEWKVKMDREKLRVFLHVEPGYIIDYAVLDEEPNQHIELSIVKNKRMQNTLEFKDVIEEMGLLRINHGFNHSEIMLAIEATEPAVYVIAEGKPPVDGKNGWFELKVNTKVEVGLKEKEDGRIDFRELKAIPYVDKGKVIGIVHPPILGQLGYTVTNEPILARQTFPLVVQEGKGVTVLGDKIIASEPGRPRIEERGLIVKVSIIPKFIHVGNVDLVSGNITFGGDVEILGGVTERMSVVAAGSVEIHKTINNAVISSIGGVILHSASINSKVSAGNLDFFEIELEAQLEKIIETVDEIITVFEKVTSSDTFKDSEYIRGSIQPLIRILVDRKFSEFPHTIKKFTNSISKAEVYMEDETWRRIGDSLSQLFVSLTVETVFHESLQQMVFDMKNIMKNNSELINEKVIITASNATNSKLYCSGDIFITGHGCINTEIRAGGFVLINGILRGGKVYGGMGVTIEEAGAPNSTLTAITVPHNQAIRIDKALEGVILKIGQDVYKFTETAYHVHACINENNKLIVDYKYSENFNRTR